MTPIVYRSNDASAPVLSALNNQTLSQVLKACLVTGYGAKPAAGWSLVYEVGFDMTFRAPALAGSPSEGSRYYLRLADAASTTNIFIHVYSDMTAYNAGEILVTNAVWEKTSTLNGTVRPWTVIADDRCFYLFLNTNQTSYGSTSDREYGYFFGDIIPYPRDLPGCGMLVAGDSGSHILRPYLPSAATTKVDATVAPAVWAFGYPPYPDVVMRASLMGFHLDNALNSLGSNSAADNFTYPDPATGKVNFHQPFVIGCATAYMPTNVLLGRMPGLIVPMHGNTPAAFDTFVGNGRLLNHSFLTYPAHTALNAQQQRLCIDLTDLWTEY